MKIGRFAKEKGISVETIRYYDRIGLLKSDREAGLRDYKACHGEKLRNIEILKHCNFTLEEIHRIFLLEDAIEQGDFTGLDDLILLFEQKTSKLEEDIDCKTKGLMKLKRSLTKMRTLDHERLQEIVEEV